jgi:hypothetical protein
MSIISEVFELPLRNQYLKKFGKYTVGNYEKDYLIKHILIEFLANNTAKIEIKAQDNVGIFFHTFLTHLKYEELANNYIKVYFSKIE